MTGATATGPTTMTAVLTRTERPDPTFGAAEVKGWQAGALDRLTRLGLLAETDPAAAAVCTACDFDHVEPVRWHREQGLPPRACVACARGGITWLAPDELRRWVVRPPVLAKLVAGAVGAAGGVVERVPGRVWKLGTVRAGGRVWVGALAVGLTRPDAAAVVEAAPELRAANALVFVPATLPSDSAWSAGRTPAVVPLCDLLALGPSGLVADRDALVSTLVPTARPVPKAPRRVFAAPPGTVWERVELAVEEHHVRVRVGDAADRFGFAEAGFEDRREKDTPDELWALLTALARFRGVLGTADGIATKPGRLKQKVSALRDRLRALIGPEGDPFHPTGKGRPYRARFAIRAAGAATFPTPPGATWDDVTVTETAAGVIEVGVAVEERGAEYVRGDEEDGGDGGRWQGVTGTGERRTHCSLTDLGLGDPDDLTPAGAVLVAVLRAGGRLIRPANDPDLLALGAALARYFQLADPPFTFDPTRRVWAARFTAASVVPASDR